jgi:hypothetical protein
LWSGKHGGGGTHEYLRRRGLRDETIRAARLGFWDTDTYRSGIFEGAKVWIPQGIIIPWFDEGSVVAVNVRRPGVRKGGGGHGPRSPDDPKNRKYHMLKGSRRTIYPGRHVPVPGSPLVLAEGELDTLLLNQELAGLVPAVTLGSASDRRPRPEVLLAMSVAAPWFVSGDSDEAGMAAAESWLARSARCRRVMPPHGKDWTDAHRGGVNLRRWWEATLTGTEGPPPNTSEDLAGWRWGPAEGDPTPGVDNPGRRPSLETLAAALDPAADPDFAAERRAIQAEDQS